MLYGDTDSVIFSANGALMRIDFCDLYTRMIKKLEDYIDYPGTLVNNSISAYKHKHDGAMWIPDVYSNIKSFLNQDDRLSLCIAHDLQIEDKRPDPYKNKPEINPEYIMWSLRQVQKPLSFNDSTKNFLVTITRVIDILELQKKYIKKKHMLECKPARIYNVSYDH